MLNLPIYRPSLCRILDLDFPDFHQLGQRDLIIECHSTRTRVKPSISFDQGTRLMHSRTAATPTALVLWLQHARSLEAVEEFFRHEVANLRMFLPDVSCKGRAADDARSWQQD